jgi:hypothetical protein
MASLHVYAPPPPILHLLGPALAACLALTAVAYKLWVLRDASRHVGGQPCTPQVLRRMLGLNQRTGCFGPSTQLAHSKGRS